MGKFVYQFSEGNDKMRNLLGGKGANLAGMKKLGLPVPDGFTVTTNACMQYYDDGEVLRDSVVKEIFKALAKLEKTTQKSLGGLENPLLVSVRSGARVSMPGMMDTVLNLGINDEVVKVLAELTQDERFAYDSYRRFIMMFGDVVKGLHRDVFEDELVALKKKKGIADDLDLKAEDFKELAEKFKEIYERELQETFPQDPKTQLLEAVKAVFRSWETERAKVYRDMNDIPDDWGTAVNVQMMAFGNMGSDSGSGVAFTRNPSTGEKTLYGEFLINAQGEDVVAGVRTPQSIEHLKDINLSIYNEFVGICNKLENHFKDMQDMEFTIEHGKLYMLQTRNGKRTAKAGLQVAIDLVKEGLLTKREALLKVDPKTLDTLLHPTFSKNALKQKPVATGLPASPGAGSGVIALTPAKAKAFKAEGKPSILVREETNPEDIEGMVASNGVLTATGGMTSHAAVVARGIGTACVAGCSALSVNEKAKTVTISGQKLSEGDYISIDGSTGNVYVGQLETEEVGMSENFTTILSWADEIARMGVRANADNGRDALKAKELGAQGIGLCRTEHMFFETNRIKAVREMILADNAAEREKALSQVLEVQRQDFIDLFTVMKGLPVTIRFLDMPLHEFLPKEESEIKELATIMGKTYEELKKVVDELTEFNPMMGFRGCRLSIVMPEIARMQTRAVIEAAIHIKKEYGIDQAPEIMIPLVGLETELKYMKRVVSEVADALILESGEEVTYKIGTMIEVPRATIIADKLASVGEFFSFGTNDLTQMTFGFSRDDAGKFLVPYKERKIITSDPFVHLDEVGVTTLIERAVKLGRSVNKKLKCGICGEHGGDPASIEIANRLGLNYVSCSPYRVPIARLAVAQSVVRQGK